MPSPPRLPPRRRPLLAAAAAAALRPAAAAAPPWLLLAPRRAAAQGGDPAAVVERFHAALIAVMRAAAAGLGVAGRFERLRPVMEASFDLPAMARIAVGPPWAQMSAAQQAALVAAFSRWSIATYANRFDGYSGERFVTDGETALRSGDRLVRTRLLRPEDAPVQLNYLLRQTSAGWRIVDVYLTGTISELASRRSEFTAVLRDGGPDRLVAELRQRTEALMRG